MKKQYQFIKTLFVVVLILSLTASTALAGKGGEDIKALFSGEEAYSHIEALTGLGPRVAGGDAEEMAAGYIADVMEGYGLDVEIQEFPTIYFEDNGSTLEVVGGPVLNPNAMLFSPAGGFTEQIVDCGLGYRMEGRNDFPPEVAGNIALIRRGSDYGELFYFRDKAKNAADADAVAAVIYNNVDGALFGALGEITPIPVVGISLEEGNNLLELMASGTVTVYLNVDTIVYESTSRNVIGTLEGNGPDQGIVYLGAHYDSVSVGTGANDNASGVGAVLEAARVLSTKGHRTKATLKFIAFGAEETGLNGSLSYIIANEEEVMNKGIGMINLDMISVGDILQIGNIGISGPELVNYTQNKATAMGLTWEPIMAMPNSDHTYFEQVGVPVALLHQDPDPYYHTPEDTLDKIDITRLEENGELATAVMYDWAKNPVRRAKKAARLEKVHVYHDKVHAAR